MPAKSLKADIRRWVIGPGTLPSPIRVPLTAESGHPGSPVDAHRLRIDVLGEALGLAESSRRGEESLPGLDGSALVGLTSEDPGAVQAYVRRLLDGVDGELAARLLEDRTL